MSEGDGRGANGLSERIMADLKDFQRDTVNYVFRRLYEDKDTARRFLIASETGLGKTLIARGVIARVDRSSSGAGRPHRYSLHLLQRGHRSAEH